MKYILILLLLIFLFLLSLYIKFEIKFSYGDEGYKLDVFTSFLFDLIKYKSYSLNKKTKKNSNQKASLKELYNKKTIRYIWDKSILKEIRWKTKIGFTDAALTSFVYGLIWWFKSVILGIIQRNKRPTSIYMNVIPVFDKNQLDIDFNCIIKIKMVYIIIVWILILKSFRGGERFDRTSNRRLNENYYE